MLSLSNSTVILRDGLDENAIQAARKEFGKNVLRAANTRRLSKAGHYTIKEVA